MRISAIQYPFDDVSSGLTNSSSQSKEISDIDWQKSTPQQLRQALKDSEDRYALTTQITTDGLWEWDLDGDRINYSSRWKSMVGCQDAEINNHPVEWLVRVHPKDISKLEQNLSACRQGEIAQFEIKYSLLHRDGQYRLMQCRCIAARNDRGKVVRLIGSQTDITARQETEAQLNRYADYDRLTNLFNRQLFVKKLRELSRSKQDPDYMFGILYLDLDCFKNINYNFGYEIGDRLLVEVVHKLQSCLRMQDLIARLGGDEFAILLAGFDWVNYPLEVAAEIQQELSLPIKIDQHSIFITTSIGIALPYTVNASESSLSNTPDNLTQLLQNAEIAMEQAKTEGKACNIVFRPTVYQQKIAKFCLEDDLKTAIEQEQFELHYQPIVNLRDRQVVGFEALVRWQHPIRGLVFPDDFVSLAEETGLIIPIGWWVLRAACLQMVQWQQQNPHAASMYMSVNITAKQLAQPYAGDIVTQIITKTGLDPHCLKLEITESEIIENVNLVLSTINKLTSLGIRLSMDDFGTGYSSLKYLHYLPINTLKIDRCFIRSLESDRHHLELVKTIIKLAEVFELDLIAEGIETEQQCDLLEDLGCQYGQGYLFSKALPPEIAASLFK
ncbi:EAL domain-containing protein [Pleurocapsales cyanobacterium LEGE 10410]|nr:EAL domain-containing protein [Pleurocapsales cyanobacterium LEGE 10410]